MVHVWHTVPSPHYGRVMRGGLEDAGREVLDARVRCIEEAGSECEESVVFGRPQQTIVTAAEEVGADPAVLGAEGMSRLEHAPIGSVSEEALRKADRTVFVVGGHPEGDGAVGR